MGRSCFDSAIFAATLGTNGTLVVSVWAACLLFAYTLPICLVSADEIAGGESSWPQRCANIRTSYNPDADLQKAKFFPPWY